MTWGAKFTFVRIVGFIFIPYVFNVASNYMIMTLSKLMTPMEIASIFVPTAAMRIMWNVRTAVNSLMKAS